MNLKEIASTLQQKAAATGGPAQRKLGRGLTVTLCYQEGEWGLSLTREGILPSAKEEQICRDAFDVPAKITYETVAIGKYRIIRINWKDKPA